MPGRAWGTPARIIRSGPVGVDHIEPATPAFLLAVAIEGGAHCGACRNGLVIQGVRLAGDLAHGWAVPPVAIVLTPDTHDFMALGWRQVGAGVQGKPGAALPTSARGRVAFASDVEKYLGQWPARSCAFFAAHRLIPLS